MNMMKAIKQIGMAIISFFQNLGSFPLTPFFKFTVNISLSYLYFACMQHFSLRTKKSNRPQVRYPASPSLSGETLSRCPVF